MITSESPLHTRETLTAPELPILIPLLCNIVTQEQPVLFDRVISYSVTVPASEINAKDPRALVSIHLADGEISSTIHISTLEHDIAHLCIAQALDMKGLDMFDIRMEILVNMIQATLNPHHVKTLKDAMGQKTQKAYETLTKYFRDETLCIIVAFILKYVSPREIAFIVDFYHTCSHVIHTPANQAAIKELYAHIHHETQRIVQNINTYHTATILASNISTQHRDTTLRRILTPLFQSPTLSPS